MVSMGFSGQMSVIVLAGDVVGIVRIQTLGAIWVGKLISEVFLINIEHLRAISVMLFAYRAVMQLGGLESG